MRWEAVNAAEQEELCKTSPAQKFHQLATLMASVEELDWTEALTAEEDEVWKRWNRLRQRYKTNKSLSLDGEDIP